MQDEARSSPRVVAPLRVLVGCGHAVAPVALQRLLEDQGRTVRLMRPNDVLREEGAGGDVLIVPLDATQELESLYAVEKALAQGRNMVFYLHCPNGGDMQVAADAVAGVPGVLFFGAASEHELARLALCWPEQSPSATCGRTAAWRDVLREWPGPGLACRPGGGLAAVNDAMRRLLGRDPVCDPPGAPCSEVEDDLIGWRLEHPSPDGSCVQWEVDGPVEGWRFAVCSIPLRNQVGGADGEPLQPNQLVLGWDVSAREDLRKRLTACEDLLHRDRDVLLEEGRRELEEEAARFRNARRRERERAGFAFSVLQSTASPLTGVLGFAKLLEKQVRKLEAGADGAQVAARMASDLTLLLVEGQRLHQLAFNAVELLRLDEKQTPPGPSTGKSAALATVVHEGVKVLSRMLGQGENPLAVVEQDADGAVQDSLFVAADGDQLRAMVVNLLFDAALHADGGAVRIRMSRKGENAVVLEVRDSGSPVSEIEWRMAFDMLYQAVRADTPSETPRGSSLGLALARRQAELYGGGVDGWTEPEGENVLRLVLPAAVTV